VQHVKSSVQDFAHQLPAVIPQPNAERFPTALRKLLHGVEKRRRPLWPWMKFIESLERGEGDI
jgi:hypothetical protein